MKKRKLPMMGKLIIGCVALALLFGFASCRSERVDPRRHPNLAAAQTFIERAMERISDAQSANDFDMDGHAAKAKTLLEQAYSEVKLAALAANAHP